MDITGSLKFVPFFAGKTGGSSMNSNLCIIIISVYDESLLYNDHTNDEYDHY